MYIDGIEMIWDRMDRDWHYREDCLGDWNVLIQENLSGTLYGGNNINLSLLDIKVPTIRYMEWSDKDRNARVQPSMSGVDTYLSYVNNGRIIPSWMCDLVRVGVVDFYMSTARDFPFGGTTSVKSEIRLDESYGLYLNEVYLILEKLKHINPTVTLENIAIKINLGQVVSEEYVLENFVIPWGEILGKISSLLPFTDNLFLSFECNYELEQVVSVDLGRMFPA